MNRPARRAARRPRSAGTLWPPPIPNSVRPSRGPAVAHTVAGNPSQRAADRRRRPRWPPSPATAAHSQLGQRNDAPPCTSRRGCSPAAAGALPLDDANTTPPTPAHRRQPSAAASVSSSPRRPPIGNPPTRIDAPQGNMRLLGPGDVVGVDSGTDRPPLPGSRHRGQPTPPTWRASTSPPPTCRGASPRHRNRDRDRRTRAGSRENRLRPWLVLLAVTADNEVRHRCRAVPADHRAARSTTRPAPELGVGARPTRRPGGATDPGRGRSRLLCPRNCPSGTPMRAVLVPAFRARCAPPRSAPRRPRRRPPPTVHQPAWGGSTATAR